MNKIKRFLKMFLYSFISKKTLITIIIILFLLLLKNNVFATDYTTFTETYNNTEYVFHIADNYFSTYTYYIVTFYKPNWANYPYACILMSNGEIKSNGTGKWVSTSSIYTRGQGLYTNPLTIDYQDIIQQGTTYNDSTFQGIIASNYTVLDFHYQ